MKNRKILLIIISMLILILVSFFYYKKYYYNVIDTNLMNKTWYKYNSTNGYFDKIYFDSEKIVFKSYDNNTLCDKYTYDKKNKIFNFNCDNKIKINKVNTNKIELNVDGNNEKYFNNLNDSLNYEFEKYYKKNISEYKKEFSRVKDLTKIDYSSLVEIINGKDYSTIYITGNNCTSIDCVSVLGTIEKLLYDKNNIYYLDINDLTEEELNNINKISNEFNKDKEYYDGIYPRVLVVNNKNIIDEYEFKCEGLNCNKYLDYKY